MSRFSEQMDEFERDDLAAEARQQRRYRQQLATHPHPQDPDFPKTKDEDHDDD